MVEVLYFEGCPNHPGAVELAREVIAELRLGAEVQEVEVRDAADAERLRFLGSPSVRVNGVDVEPGADEHSEYALSCRTYAGSGVPTKELLVNALKRGAEA